jgi:hypothetical protein
MSRSKKAELPRSFSEAMGIALAHSPRNGQAAIKLQKLVEESGDEWATAARTEFMDRGAYILVKQAREKMLGRLSVKGGSAKGGAGVRVADANGATHHEQLALLDLTYAQVADARALNASHRDVAVLNIAVQDRLLLLQARHPSTTTVREGLAAEGTTLDEWLADVASA